MSTAINPDLTVKQTALQLQTTVATVRQLIKSKKLKSYNLGERNTRVTLEAIEALRESA